MSVLRAVGKVAGAAAAGVLAVKVAENTGKLIDAANRGAAKAVRAGSAKVGKLAGRVRERRAGK